MTLAVITKSNWLSLAFVVLFMKSSHALGTVSVKFYGSIVDFTKSLQFDIVSPNTRLVFSVAVVNHAFVCNKHLEVVLASQNIAHALLPNFKMVVTCSIGLVRDRPEQTISIAFHVHNH